MLETSAGQLISGYYQYPPAGADDWRYIFQCAQVRTLEMQMLSRPILLDLVNADSFESAASTLAGTGYSLGSDTHSLAALEEVLAESRRSLRETFEQLMLDDNIVELFKARSDYANLRLAIRRLVTDRPLGADYSTDGNVDPALFEQIFTEENYSLLPDYLHEALDEAVLSYYQNKDIRQIDYAIDRMQSAHNLRTAASLKSEFLIGLFGIIIDLTNIRTMLRLKFADSQQRGVLLEGGFVELDYLERALEGGFEQLSQLFAATPYQKVVDSGSAYLASDRSFLKVEQECEAYLAGFLKTTSMITAGPQPVIAYLLMKENEIRTVRLILTSKKSRLDTRLIMDRIPQGV